jgi:hypothetical protein
MGQSFGDRITLVEVKTDISVRGVPKSRLWAAAANPEQALTLVLNVIPEGWAVSLSDESLTPEQEKILNLGPGEACELTR